LVPGETYRRVRLKDQYIKWNDIAMRINNKQGFAGERIQSGQ